jgi:hypothetical protein
MILLPITYPGGVDRLVYYTTAGDFHLHRRLQSVHALDIGMKENFPTRLAYRYHVN